MSRLSKRRAREFRELADQFCHERGVIQCEVRDVVAWAMTRGVLSMSRQDQCDYFVKQLSTSLQSDVTKDSQGRKVRLRHCLKVEATGPDGAVRQQYLWAHVNEAPVSFLMQSLLQRRDQVTQDQHALEADLAFVNASLQNRGLRPIQMELPWVHAAA